MSNRLTRRTALKLLGTTAVGAGLPWLRAPSAFGQSTDVPLRILFVEAGYGCRRTTFEPAGMATPYVDRITAETNWSFRNIMAPLAPYQSRANLFQNLDMLSAKADPSSPANAHIHGMTHMLTAASRLNGSSELGGGVSIDQYIAQQLVAQGVPTRLPSFEVMATSDASEFSRSVNHDSYSSPGQKVPFITYVPDAWDRLFPEPLQAPTGDDGVAKMRRSAIFNFVRGDYDRLLGKVSPEDREKLMQMRDYRADLHAAANVSNDRAQNRPDKSTIMTPWSQLDEGYDKGSPSNPTWRVHCEIMTQLAAAALHTDTTRVVNLSLPSPPGYEFGYNAGDFGTSDAHDMTHKVSGDQPTLTDPNAVTVHDRAHTMVYERVAYVLDTLAALRETDGKSLLDHTIVVLYSHLAEGSHDLTRLPWIVFGDAQGQFKTGQYIRFPAMNWRNGNPVAPNDTKTGYQWDAEGRAHNDLFVTLANAMGITTNTFGNPNVCKGAIAEMLA